MPERDNRRAIALVTGGRDESHGYGRVPRASPSPSLSLCIEIARKIVETAPFIAVVINRLSLGGGWGGRA